MTTISDEQKKNAVKALRALESYRDKQLQMERVNAQPVRRGRVHRHEYRLEAVKSGVSLLEALNADLGERSQDLKMMERAFQRASMAQTKGTLKDEDQARLFDAIALAEQELRRMTGDNAIPDDTKAPTDSPHPDDPTSSGIWSAPLAPAEIARRITGKSDARSRDIALFKRWHVEPVTARKIRIRLDSMNEGDRAKIENPNFFQPLRATSATTARRP